MTLWAAYQHFEEATKGSIDVGKVADFAVLSDNPIAVDPLKIADIKVVETIKAGRSVYRRSAEQKAEADGFGDSCAASPRCFTAMAGVGAELVGMEGHRH